MVAINIFLVRKGTDTIHIVRKASHTHVWSLGHKWRMSDLLEQLHRYFRPRGVSSAEHGICDVQPILTCKEREYHAIRSQ